MSLTLKPLSIQNESELVSLASSAFQEEPFQYKILDREVGTKQSGTADLIGLDGNKGLILIHILSSGKEAGGVNASLSNYYWACENILNIKKMYPQFNIDPSVTPKIIYLAKSFSPSVKRNLSLLNVPVETAQYQSFEVNGIPCIHLEKTAVSESSEALWDIQVERLKKEFSGSNALSEDEIATFLNFEKEYRSE